MTFQVGDRVRLIGPGSDYHDDLDEPGRVSTGEIGSVCFVEDGRVHVVFDQQQERGGWLVFDDNDEGGIDGNIERVQE